MSSVVRLHITSDGSLEVLAERLGHAASSLSDKIQNTMEDATRDLAPDLRRSAIDRLPKRGGLASTISSGMHVRAITFASFDVIRTEVDVSHKYDISGMDDTGIVIHPLFGNRGHWYLEHTHARGFISRVYNETVRKIDHGVHLDVDEIAAELDA